MGRLQPKDKSQWQIVGRLVRYTVPRIVERNRKGNLKVYCAGENREQAETFQGFDELGEKNPSWLSYIELTTKDATVVRERENALKRKQDGKTIRVLVWRGVAEVDEDTLPEAWSYEIIDDDSPSECEE